MILVSRQSSGEINFVKDTRVHQCRILKIFTSRETSVREAKLHVEVENGDDDKDSQKEDDCFMGKLFAAILITGTFFTFCNENNFEFFAMNKNRRNSVLRFHLLERYRSKIAKR